MRPPNPAVAWGPNRAAADAASVRVRLGPCPICISATALHGARHLRRSLDTLDRLLRAAAAAPVDPSDPSAASPATRPVAKFVKPCMTSDGYMFSCLLHATCFVLSSYAPSTTISAIVSVPQRFHFPPQPWQSTPPVCSDHLPARRTPSMSRGGPSRRRSCTGRRGPSSEPFVQMGVLRPSSFLTANILAGRIRGGLNVPHYVRVWPSWRLEAGAFPRFVKKGPGRAAPPSGHRPGLDRHRHPRRRRPAGRAEGLRACGFLQPRPVLLGSGWPGTQVEGP